MNKKKQHHQVSCILICERNKISFLYFRLDILPICFLHLSIHMSARDSVFILNRVFTEHPLIESLFLDCSDSNQFETLIQSNKQCKIILVCKAEHVEELYHSNTVRYIHEIIILGDYRGPCFQGKKITMINTNEEDLKCSVLCSALGYTRDEEIIQKELGNSGLAELLKNDSLKLLEEIEKLL